MSRYVLTAVIVVSLVVLTGTAALVVSPSLREFVGVGPSLPPPAYGVGDVIDVSPVVYQSAARTLLLFARSDCAACQRSEAFHRSALALAAQAETAVALMTPGDLETESSYAERLGVTPDHVHRIAGSSIRLRTVPTLMLVDVTGRIQHVWFGESDAATEALILSTLAGAGLHQ